MEEGVRPRTPNPPYTTLTKEQQSSIERDASPIFLNTSLQPTFVGPCRRFRQRQSESIATSQLRTSEEYGHRTHYTYITPEPYTATPPSKHNGCAIDAYPKWYPNQAGERVKTHLGDSEPVERHVAIDNFRRPPTARAGQILFDHGRPNDGYYLERQACM